MTRAHITTMRVGLRKYRARPAMNGWAIPFFIQHNMYTCVRACGQQLVSPRPAGADLGTRRQSQPRARTPAVGACRPPGPKCGCPLFPGSLPFRRRRRPASQLPPRPRRASKLQTTRIHACARTRTHGGFCREPPRRLVAWSGARRFSRAPPPSPFAIECPRNKTERSCVHCFDHVTCIVQDVAGEGRRWCVSRCRRVATLIRLSAE